MNVQSSGPSHERDVHGRAREIRAGLPGQLRRARLATASMLYGPLYSLEELHRQIARTLPWRLGRVRRVKVEAIERSETEISDAVLLKYDDALQVDVFSRFLIVTPAYYVWPAGDPALVAEVADSERWALVARWRDERLRAQEDGFAW